MENPFEKALVAVLEEVRRNKQAQYNNWKFCIEHHFDLQALAFRKEYEHLLQLEFFVESELKDARAKSGEES